ncbi:MAG: alanine dehydrogenase [Gammaproteobacteria bacterium HGW-Gammaproteobacteria-3]|nr:MAG: alanine dehydrogenase [Gammaproteobacteria bacterium HGW-Gammaproteobacteria-3]
MRIGVPKEIKDQEGRVGLTPAVIQELVALDHEVFVETGAGEASGFADQLYEQSGATMVDTESAWDTDLVVKVKEPLPQEYPFLQRQSVFTFFHLAGVDPGLTAALLNNGTTAIAYEALEDDSGGLPLLAPMSAIAGNMATLMGAYYLAEFNAGKGVLLGAVLGQKQGRVLVVGDGIVGTHAASVASAMGAEVVVAGISEDRMRMLKRTMLPQADFILSNEANLSCHVAEADLVVGAVLCRNARAPKVITEQMIKTLSQGSVVVDVSIDQGGCIETSMPTTHSQPVFSKHGVVHYCVSNMPGAYPRTSTLALVAATLPYVAKIAANKGSKDFDFDPGVAKAVLTCQGKLTNESVAQALGLMADYQAIEAL